MPAITGILLAAGASQRFGAAKLLHPLANGTPVGIAAARTLVQAVPNSFAVVRPEDRLLAEELSKTGLVIVENPVADNGMSTSLAAALRALPDADGWLIALADMPWVQPATVRKLVQKLENGASIVAPCYEGQRGNPVGFSAGWKDSLLNLTGDEGARKLIAQHTTELTLLITKDRGVIEDIDYPSDIARDQV